MTDANLELGPVDDVVAEFPARARSLTGEMAAEPLASLDGAR
jgi:hypothetical protein